MLTNFLKIQTKLLKLIFIKRFVNTLTMNIVRINSLFYCQGNSKP